MIVNEEINTISEEQVLHNKLSFEINQELVHLMKRIVELQQENARLKETLKKITNYIKEHDCDYIYLDCKFLETQIYNDLLQMLNKLKEN